MVLESLFNPFVVKKKPWEMFFAGFLYSSIGLLLSILVFQDMAGLLMVFFTVIAATPIVYNTIKNEEELDLNLSGEITLLKEHSKVLYFLLFFFLGSVASYTLAYVFLPATLVSIVFASQTVAIGDINRAVTTGSLTQFGIFKGIFFNNMRVLFFCLIFSFLYGIGALFILTWNASVVSAAIGNLIKTKISVISAGLGFETIASYFSITAMSLLRYLSHGIIEIAAYFIAGLAGGIISIAVIKHHLEDERVLYDALDLIFISIAVLFVSCVFEVYITPIFFY
ncbi:hypothetical protein HN385_07065 [archaeon]|jgi:uncharacterized membrane protein SpoIIM required for sporulation|nr:hypothetical protein [archaeon]MBT3450981.1 hypothetical protein [archaeon]MBT6868599.1 hypothetical protein [archaeon]MBT7193131.1 hypothetical protein [archaeon]MBT7381111.1 hypothetical protein [archaeon]